MQRRELLAAGAGTLVALAGCTGGDHDVPPPTGTLVVRGADLSTSCPVEVFVVDVERGEPVLDEVVPLGGSVPTHRWSLGRGTLHVQVSTPERRRTHTWDVTDSTRRLTVTVDETGVGFASQTRNVGR